jgi:hypothetical protein
MVYHHRFLHHSFEIIVVNHVLMVILYIQEEGRGYTYSIGFFLVGPTVQKSLGGRRG